MVSGFGLLGYMMWWKNRPLEPFTFKYTNFLSENATRGGSDKFGHLWTNYIMVRELTSIYKSFNIRHFHSLLLSNLVAFLIYTGIEIRDGMTAYAFETEDILFNVAGMGFATTAELFSDFDRYFKIRLSWIPSPAFIERLPGKSDFTTDYSGSIFYFDYILPFNRYILVGVNWSSSFYSDIDFDPDKKERFFGIHAGINLTEFITQKFKSRNVLSDVLLFLDRYIALPFTVVDYRVGLNSGEQRVSFGINAYLFYNF